MNTHHTSPTITTLSGPDITDYTLREVLALFNNHYGRYGKHAEELNPYLTPGTHVQLSLARLRHLNISDVDVCELAIARAGEGGADGQGEVVGCAFATRWKYDAEDGKGESDVCWFTLLVVHRSHREQGLATHLIKSLIRPTDRFWGIASWSTAGCKALHTACTGNRISELDTNPIIRHARGILRRCEISNLHDAPLQGKLFQSEPEEGIVSCINTKNFVDLGDVEAGIRRAGKEGGWVLGKIPEGGEFLVVVENKDVKRE